MSMGGTPPPPDTHFTEENLSGKIHVDLLKSDLWHLKFGSELNPVSQPQRQRGGEGCESGDKLGVQRRSLLRIKTTFMLRNKLTDAAATNSTL